MLEEEYELPILILYLFCYIIFSSYLTSFVIQDFEDANRKIINYQQIDNISNSIITHDIINKNKVLYEKINKDDDILVIIDNSPSSFFLIILIETLFPENNITVFNYGRENTCYIEDLCCKLDMNFTNFDNNYILKSNLYLYTKGIKNICEDQNFNHCFTNINNNDYMMLLHESIYLDKYSNNFNNIFHQQYNDINIYNPLYNTKYDTISKLLDNNKFVLENVNKTYDLHNEYDYKYVYWRENTVKKYKELCDNVDKKIL